MGSFGRLTVRYERAHYRSDAQTTHYRRYGDVLDWDYTTQAEPGRNRQSIILGYLNDSHEQITFRAGLVYHRLTAFTRYITDYHYLRPVPHWVEARLHRWGAALPVGMALKPAGVLGRWMNLYVGLEGRYGVPESAPGSHPWYEEAKTADKARMRLVHHWGLSLFPESKVRGYIYAQDMFWQLARNESLPKVLVGFEARL